MFPQAVGKQLSVVLGSLQGELLTYPLPNSLIGLLTDVLLDLGAPTREPSHLLRTAGKGENIPGRSPS